MVLRKVIADSNDRTGRRSQAPARALALREGGYEVGVGTFCPRDLTPRNLLIRADLPQRP